MHFRNLTPVVCICNIVLTSPETSGTHSSLHVYDSACQTSSLLCRGCWSLSTVPHITCLTCWLTCLQVSCPFWISRWILTVCRGFFFSPPLLSHGFGHRCLLSQMRSLPERLLDSRVLVGSETLHMSIWGALSNPPSVSSIPSAHQRMWHAGVLMDNTAAMSCLNRQRGARSDPLYQDTVDLWSICIKNVIALKTSHLWGVQNCLIDHLSRTFSRDYKWSLRMYIAKSIFQTWGMPEIDLFAKQEQEEWSDPAQLTAPGPYWMPFYCPGRGKFCTLCYPKFCQPKALGNFTLCEVCEEINQMETQLFSQ